VGGGSHADSIWRSKSDLEVYDGCKTDSGQVRDPRILGGNRSGKTELGERTDDEILRYGNHNPGTLPGSLDQCTVRMTATYLGRPAVTMTFASRLSFKRSEVTGLASNTTGVVVPEETCVPSCGTRRPFAIACANAYLSLHSQGKR
jgi:hypothetical protein